MFRIEVVVAVTHGIHLIMFMSVVITINLFEYYLIGFEHMHHVRKHLKNSVNTK
jgi:hypothetical protein